MPASDSHRPPEPDGTGEVVNQGDLESIERRDFVDRGDVECHAAEQDARGPFSSRGRINGQACAALPMAASGPAAAIGDVEDVQPDLAHLAHLAGPWRANIGGVIVG